MSEHTARRSSGGRNSTAYRTMPSERGRRQHTVASLLFKTAVSLALLSGATYHAVHTTLSIWDGTSVFLTGCVAIYLLKDAAKILRDILWMIGQLMVRVGGKIKQIASASVRDILLTCPILIRGLKLMASIGCAAVILALLVNTTVESVPEEAPAPVKESPIPARPLQSGGPALDFMRAYTFFFSFPELRDVPAAWPKIPQTPTNVAKYKQKIISDEPLSILPNLASRPPAELTKYATLPSPIIGEIDSEVPPVLSIILLPPCLLFTVTLALDPESMRDCVEPPSKGILQNDGVRSKPFNTFRLDPIH